MAEDRLYHVFGESLVSVEEAPRFLFKVNSLVQMRVPTLGI